MWTPVLIFIAAWIPEGSLAMFLEVSPSDWLEFSCDYPEQGHHMKCDVNIRCGGTSRQESSSHCNSTVCSDITSTRRNGPSPAEPESGKAVGHISAQDSAEMDLEDPGCTDDMVTFKEMMTAGESFSHTFTFKSEKFVQKFLCKGGERLSCRFLDHGKHRLQHNNESSSNISFQVRDVKIEDNGIYWLGIKEASRPEDHFFFLRVILIILPSPPWHPTVATIVLLACAVALLIFMLLLVPLLVYKVCLQKHSCGEDDEKDEVNEANESNMNNYEQILPGTVAKTIYVTAHFSTNHHLSSDGNSTVTLKRSDCSTEHLYSTLSPPLQ